MSEEEVWQYGDTELLDELRQAQDVLNAQYGRLLGLTAELLTRGLVAAKGYADPVRLLQDLQRISKAEAVRRVDHAKALTPAVSVTGAPLPPRMPATAVAVKAGAIGVEQVEVIRRTVVALPPETAPQVRDLVEKTLVNAAHTVGPAAISTLGRAMAARLDQDGRPPTDAELRQPVNELHWVTRGGGALELKGRLCAEGGALLTAVLSPLAKPRPAVEGELDLRSPAERNGDALIEALQMVAKSGQLPTEAGEPPNLVVTISLDALRAGSGGAILGDSTLIDARQARRIACDSAVIPAVLGSASEPLDIGRKTRTVPAAMRRALTLRDKGCAFPGCAIPAGWADAHHLHHWRKAALPAWTTRCCSAAHTTDSCTTPTGQSPSTTASPSSPHPRSSTRPANPAATPSTTNPLVPCEPRQQSARSW